MPSFTTVETSAATDLREPHHLHMQVDYSKAAKLYKNTNGRIHKHVDPSLKTKISLQSKYL